jgi:outer membrane protein TolC
MFAYRHFLALSTSSFVIFGSAGSAIAQDASIPHIPSLEEMQPSASKTAVKTVAATEEQINVGQNLAQHPPGTNAEPALVSLKLEPAPPQNLPQNLPLLAKMGSLAAAQTNPASLPELASHLQSPQGVLAAATTAPKTRPALATLPGQGSLSPANLTVKTSTIANAATTSPTQPLPLVTAEHVGFLSQAIAPEKAMPVVTATQDTIVFTAPQAIAQAETTAPATVPTIDSEMSTAAEANPAPDTTVTTPANNTPRINEIPPELETNADLNELLAPIVEGNEQLRLPTQSETVLANEQLDLTLEEAVAIALEQNQDLQEAKLSYDRAEYQRQEAIAAEYPNLTNQTQLVYSDTTSNELQAEALGRDPGNGSTSLNNRIEVSYDLYTGGSRSGQISVAEARLKIAELEVARITKETRLDTETAYYDLQSADFQTAIEAAAVNNAKQSLDDADKLERAGLGTKFDVLRAQVDLANAEQRRIRAEANQNIARRKLAQILNLAPKADPRAADEPGIAGVWELSLEDSILLALQQREELRQQLLEWEISGHQAEIALANIRPQVSVFANYDLLDVFDDDLNVADGVSVGGRIFWNLFDGGAASARAKQEKVNQQISETRFVNQTDQIRLAVENAYYDLQASDRNIQTASIAVDLADESLRLARMRFKAGVGTQTDVIAASTELNTARNNLLQAITDYNRAYAQLKRAVSVGEELEAFSANKP